MENNKSIIASIKKDNIVAQKAFLKAGYVLKKKNKIKMLMVKE